MTNDKLKTLLMWIGLPSAMVSAWGAIVVIASTVVWASDYQRDKQLQTEFNLTMLINVTADRCRRTVDPSLKENCLRELRRHEKQLEKLLETRVK